MATAIIQISYTQHLIVTKSSTLRIDVLSENLYIGGTLQRYVVQRAKRVLKSVLL
jgi:hypothetical protein